MNIISNLKSFKENPMNYKLLKLQNQSMLSKWDKPDKYLSDQIGTMSNKKSCIKDSNLNSPKILNLKKNFFQLAKENLLNIQTMIIIGVMDWERDKIGLE